MDAAYTTDLPEAGATADAYADILTRAADARAASAGGSRRTTSRATRARRATARPATCKFLALVLATAPGPVLLYQGEELGLVQPDLPRKAAVTDPLDLLYWPDGPGREGARVPIPWDEGGDRAFTTGIPWLPMTWPEGISVAVQHIDADSVLRFYREVFAFRRDRMGSLDLADW